MRSLVRFRRALALLLGMTLVASLTASGAVAQDPDPPRLGEYEFATPVFGLSNGPAGHGVLAADAGAGVVKLNKDGGRLIAELAGVADIDPKGRHNMLAVAAAPPENETDPPGAGYLYRIDRRRHLVMPVANLTRFERRNNPDGAEVDSNVFHVTSRRHIAFVADSGGNSIVVVNTRTGKMNWVATLPTQLVSTAFVKDALGCPNPELPPEEAEVCDAPDMIPAEAVPTAVEFGPDGALYVSELTGFPAEPGTSRVWRIERGTRHADCGADRRCSVVLDGFTSIIDLDFDRRGRLLVGEMDENTWLAVENEGEQIVPSFVAGGTVNRCHLGTGVCVELATEVPALTAVLARPRGRVLAAINALIPGLAQVVRVD